MLSLDADKASGILLVLAVDILPAGMARDPAADIADYILPDQPAGMMRGPAADIAAGILPAGMARGPAAGIAD
jgi:hypothetical protein